MGLVSTDSDAHGWVGFRSVQVESHQREWGEVGGGPERFLHRTPIVRRRLTPGAFSTAQELNDSDLEIKEEPEAWSVTIDKKVSRRTKNYNNNNHT